MQRFSLNRGGNSYKFGNKDMRFTTKHSYRFVLMTTDAQVIDVLTGSLSSKTRALRWAKIKALRKGQKLGILYVTDLDTKECAIYTAGGQDWIRQRMKHMSERKDNTAAVRIGSQLRDIRLQSGMTPEEICEKAGIRLSTLASIEEGRYNSGIREIDAIVQALGVTIDIHS